ncbi:hypothetical protein HCJ52_13860 [Listeria sp. FSL L7-1485]|uniref:Uncharacterized protein n=1 Tax=Listeria immobilis TaxID=2713502 RepID=A0A7X0XAI3_9LIST|nr:MULTISPECIES: hypothetical protein [Listeria]MBC1481555.1 hypothetical protein [Listeria seeligeri]MBC1490136.1 hypothetical protein [Listeria immobilis]MBC1537201.1 hypothetical protein [Listeria immobilis]
MFTIRFEVEKPVRKLLRSIIREGVDYELRVCNTILQEAEAILLQEGISSSLHYHIKEPTIPVSFRSSVMLGEGRPMNILLLVNQTLNTVFTEKPEEEKRYLIQLLEQAFLEEPSAVEEKEQEVETPILVSPPIEETIIVKPEKSVDQRPLTEIVPENNTGKRREFRKHVQRISSFFRFSKKSWIVLFCLLFLLSLISFFVLVFSPGSKTEAVKKEPSLESLLEQKNLAKVATYYPEEWENIRLDYINEADVIGLKGMNKEKPSDLLNLDIAYFEKEYNQIVQIYEENKDLEYASIDYAFVGFSYLVKGNVKQAEVLNLYADDPDLKAYIADYKLTESSISETKQVLKRKDLTKELRTELETKLNEAEKHLQNYHQGKVEVKQNGKKETL